LRILIAEDELNLALSYKKALEKHKHEVLVTPDGEKCLVCYKNSLKQNPQLQDRSHFDAVILNYKMLKKDGMEVAKEILELNPNQRIIFVSAHVKDPLVDPEVHLKQIVEFMQEPFDTSALVETIEDKEIYCGLEKLNVNVKKIRDLNPSHKEIKDFLGGLLEIKKGITF
jgi:DNA-binding response OmpR family regulator